jgi:membrane protein
MKYVFTHFFQLLKQTYKEWQEDKAPMWGAALAYYTVFSLGPLVLVILAIAGFVLGPSAVKGEVFHDLKGFLGADGAKLIETMIKGASNKNSGIIASVIGIITLLLGASGIFGQMKAALNFIWKVETKPNAGIKGILLDRFTNLSMIGVICFLLLISLVASSATSVLSAYFLNLLPFSPIFIEIINMLISFVVTAVLFMLIYRVLPDVELPWNIALIGGAFTAILFTIGKTVIGLYIGHGSLSSSYGAASSIITLLVWVYYSAQILLFGAAFTKTYVKERGIHVNPSKLAMYTENLNQQIEGNQFATNMKELRPLVGFFLSGFIAEIISRSWKKKKK